MKKIVSSLLLVCALGLLGGCGDSGQVVTRATADGEHVWPPVATQSEVDALASAIRALGPRVDPEEAARAARIAYSETHKLALDYQITDPPLIHNMKVNHGLRKRGLCWQWADDLEARLEREKFRTLTLHRAIANAFNPILIDHSTLLISQVGDNLQQGIVLDPWRKGGALTWKPTAEDTRYHWVPEAEVFARKRELGMI